VPGIWIGRAKEPGVTTRLNPYLSFDGNAREAIEFYKDVFGGELQLNTVGEYGDASAPGADRIMHAWLKSPSGYDLMVADTQPGMPYQPGNNISLSLSGDNDDELRGYWDKLSSGGTITVPLEKQMWGDVFGACIDKFGISWLVNIGETAN
jgi:PhnB protein